MNRFRTGTAALGALALLSACRAPVDSGWSGYAEGDYIYVAAPVAGTLKSVSVQAGQQVMAGAPLFTLDATPERAARAEADARVLAAQAQAENTTKGRRVDEVAVVRAQLAQARAQAARAETEWLRQKALVDQNFVSQSRLDDATTARTQARDRVTELEASLRVATLPARVDERESAKAQVEAAKQARQQLVWREQQTLQAAPAAGLVADTFWRAGEYVPAGQPVVSLLPPEARKARFYVPEAELGGLKIGQAVKLRCDGCGAPINARISRIATQPEYTPPVIYSNTQRTKLVFMVEARPEPADAIKLHPGQPLDVKPVP
ncbi:MAG TPA: HlyD family efflux transporter periplasmic adaptor subunit [Ideonella sp.]|uniref:HlyD family secretion protein n=1 Tax=Ideonella sp. TaxID=1929293 RepID=UPI002E30F5DB|nr:HlyD family efflux transporter periplasmic adaptor subunit [Ideonella sp.]HEX5686058.1 HlyD family efflux transporter periplasmic adaptor subunit [Ideonella sp.]